MMRIFNEKYYLFLLKCNQSIFLFKDTFSRLSQLDLKPWKINVSKTKAIFSRTDKKLIKNKKENNLPGSQLIDVNDRIHSNEFILDIVDELELHSETDRRLHIASL